MHKANLWNFLKNRSNEIRSNEIRIRREPPVVVLVVVHTTTFAKWAFAKSTEFRNMSTTQDQHVPHSILAEIGFLM